MENERTIQLAENRIYRLEGASMIEQASTCILHVFDSFVYYATKSGALYTLKLNSASPGVTRANDHERNRQEWDQGQVQSTPLILPETSRKE